MIVSGEIRCSNVFSTAGEVNSFIWALVFPLSHHTLLIKNLQQDHCSSICTDDGSSSNRNVYKMSFAYFSLSVIFIMPCLCYLGMKM